MIAAELREQPAGRIGSPDQHTVEVAIGIRGGKDGFIVRTNAGQQVPWSEGSVWIAPIGVDEEEVVATAPIPKVLHLYLPVRQFSLLADQYNLPRTPVHSMQYIGGFADELIRQIGLSLLAEIADETATGLMLAETASLMLTARLCRAYCDGNFAKLGGRHATSAGQYEAAPGARLYRAASRREHHRRALGRPRQSQRLSFRAHVHCRRRGFPVPPCQPAPAGQGDGDAGGWQAAALRDCAPLAILLAGELQPRLSPRHRHAAGRIPAPRSLAEIPQERSIRPQARKRLAMPRRSSVAVGRARLLRFRKRES